MKCQCDADVANHISHRIALSSKDVVECKDQATEKDTAGRGIYFMCKKCADYCSKEGFTYKREAL